MTDSTAFELHVAQRIDSARQLPTDIDFPRRMTVLLLGTTPPSVRWTPYDAVVKRWAHYLRRFRIGTSPNRRDIVAFAAMNQRFDMVQVLHDPDDSAHKEGKKTWKAVEKKASASEDASPSNGQSDPAAPASPPPSSRAVGDGNATSPRAGEGACIAAAGGEKKKVKKEKAKQQTVELKVPDVVVNWQEAAWFKHAEGDMELCDTIVSRSHQQMDASVLEDEALARRFCRLYALLNRIKAELASHRKNGVADDNEDNDDDEDEDGGENEPSSATAIARRSATAIVEELLQELQDEPYGASVVLRSVAHEIIELGTELVSSQATVDDYASVERWTKFLSPSSAEQESDQPPTRRRPRRGRGAHSAPTPAHERMQILLAMLGERSGDGSSVAFPMPVAEPALLSQWDRAIEGVYLAGRVGAQEEERRRRVAHDIGRIFEHHHLGRDKAQKSATTQRNVIEKLVKKGNANNASKLARLAGFLAHADALVAALEARCDALRADARKRAAEGRTTSTVSKSSSTSEMTDEQIAALYSEQKKRQKAIYTAAAVLGRKGCDVHTVIAMARVPVIRFTHLRSGLECDLCFDNYLGYVNTQLLRTYASLDERCRMLGIVVKHWAKQRGISDASLGFLSSYSFILLVIYFLQVKARLLPSLQHPALQATVPASLRLRYRGIEVSFCRNDDVAREFLRENPIEHPRWTPKLAPTQELSVGALLLGFFAFYAEEFDFAQSVVSVRQPERVWTKQTRWADGAREPWRMSIEDPLELERDLGCVLLLGGQRRIQEEFRRAMTLMKQGESMDVVCAAVEEEEEEEEAKEDGKQGQKQKDAKLASKEKGKETGAKSARKQREKKTDTKPVSKQNDEDGDRKVLSSRGEDLRKRATSKEGASRAK
ncbi:hypothetical protein P43SY_009768 [Pythium insidiosum]|uniref:PAP-associated domain-containing protein n=1 Tax=Pythium insidiosum TaxID=114742 RepID=A0AAD5QBL0_PYTIN|nr:hypothetical protein P43SY_009768 [Pythium insidiosum]